MMLVTPRCSLCAPSSADAAAITTLMTHPKVRRYLGGPVAPACAAAYAKRLTEEGHTTAWVVHRRWNPASGCIGLIQLASHHDGLDVELSYEFSPTVWGRGFASEAVWAVITYAFGSLGLTRLVAETQAGNRASRSLLERVGMRHERDVERFGAAQVIYTTGAVRPRGE